MNATIASMLLDQMNESDTDVTYYHGQRISRLYLRRVLWRSNCNADHRRSMRQASRVLPMPTTFK